MESGGVSDSAGHVGDRGPDQTTLNLIGRLSERLKHRLEIHAGSVKWVGIVLVLVSVYHVGWERCAILPT